MVDPYDPEELIVCPYDPVHKVARKRFTYHLIKCRKVREREKEGGRKRCVCVRACVCVRVCV